MSESTSSGRFQTFIAVCIALATVTGAVLAARASVLNDNANQADQSGMASTIDLALARSSDEAQRAQNLTAFLSFAQHQRTARLMLKEMDALKPDSAEWQQLDTQASAEWNKAVNSRYFFDTSYYDKFTETFDQQAFMDGKLIEAASFQDLNPDPYFNSADAGRAKAVKVVAVIALLSTALLSFAVADVFRSRFRYVLAAFGSVILIGSMALTALIESGVL